MDTPARTPLLASNVDVVVELSKLPECPKCAKGAMLPMQDESRTGAIYIKGWICNNCYHNICFRAGELYNMPAPLEKSKEY
jgi:hypothetical protein